NVHGGRQLRPRRREPGARPGRGGDHTRAHLRARAGGRTGQVAVENRLLDLLLPPSPATAAWGDESVKNDEAAERRQRSREKMKARLDAGELEDREAEITMPGRGGSPFAIVGARNVQQMYMDLLSIVDTLIPNPTQTSR